MMALYIPMQPSSKTPRMAFIAMEIGGQLASSLHRAVGQRKRTQGADMAGVMLQGFAAQPAAEAIAEEIVGEIDAPQRTILHACFGERSVQIQQADQAGPFAAPVGNREDGSAMRVEAMQQMMAVLPDGFDHDQRRVEWGYRERLPCRVSGYR